MWKINSEINGIKIKLHNFDQILLQHILINCYSVNIHPSVCSYNFVIQLQVAIFYTHHTGVPKRVFLNSVGIL